MRACEDSSRRKGRCALSLIVVSVLAMACSVAAGSAIAKTFGDGTHVIGRDAPPGTYRTRGGEGCYWARLKSFSGALSAIIANDNSSGPAVVTIGRTDRGFESARCGTWTSNLARVSKSKTRIAEGTFIVKTDIAPGTYRTRGGSGCYWARLRSFSGELSAIIANDNVSGSAVVTISRTDTGFTSSRCAIWTRL